MFAPFAGIFFLPQAAARWYHQSWRWALSTSRSVGTSATPPARPVSIGQKHSWDETLLTAYWILCNAANEILYVCECMYLSHSELALPAVDAALKGFLEGWEGHALCHDNVVVQQLGGFIWALQDVSACLLVGQHLKLYCGPLLLHLI